MVCVLAGEVRVAADLTAGPTSYDVLIEVFDGCLASSAVLTINVVPPVTVPTLTAGQQGSSSKPK